MAQRVGRGIAVLFHDRGARRGWVVSSTPRPHFTPRKEPVPILQEAAWVPGPVWEGGKSRPTRDSISNLPARRQSLYRLSCQAQNWFQYPHKYVLRRRFLISVTSHPDTPYLCEQGCEDPWLFFEAKGYPREESLGNTERGVADRLPLLGTSFYGLLLCFHLREIFVLLRSFNCCRSEYNTLHYTLAQSCSWYIKKRMCGVQPLAYDVLPTLFRHSIL